MKNQFKFIIYISAISFLMLFGCGTNKADAEKIANDQKIKNNSPAEKHKEHEHNAPNGGVLVELGEEFAHLEFVNDNVNNKIICYVYDGSLSSGLKAKQSNLTAEILGEKENNLITFKAVVNELANDTADSSSQYEADFKFEKGKKINLRIRKIVLKNIIFENIEASLMEIK
jgi:hypothetical protein